MHGPDLLFAPIHGQNGQMAWLTRGGEVLASAEVAQSRAARRKGLVGRADLDGVLVIYTRSVHTFGVRFPIDVAFCDGDGTVLKIIDMVPNRISLPVYHARMVVEARGGAFAHWGLARGDRLEVR